MFISTRLLVCCSALGLIVSVIVVPLSAASPQVSTDQSDAEHAAEESLKGLKGRITRNEDGRVVSVWISNPEVTNNDLSLLPRLQWGRPSKPTKPGVQSLPMPMLWLGSPGITDDGLEHLGTIPQLRMLHLSNTRITDAGLKHINRLPNLHMLALAPENKDDKKLGAKITDNALGHIKLLPQLRGLTIKGAAITNAGLAEHSVGLARVERLVLPYTQVSDNGLEHLKKLSKLVELDLSGTKVTSRGLVHLEDMPQLKSLFLTDTKIGDAGLAHLEGLSRLQQLFLNDTSISDAGLESVKRLTNLKILFLSGTSVSGKGLLQLKGLTKLTHLQLTNTDVSEEAVRTLHEALPKCIVIYDGGKLGGD